ncbi:MAG: DUF1801 domain-containing protein [Actinomycetota bacterium]
MSEKNSRVNGFMRHEKKWRPEYEKLREIALASGMTEELKWKHPCYTINDKNVVLIHGFKTYCAFSFFKGVLMKDPKKLLVQPTKNVQAGRQIRFANLEQIIKMEPTIKAYIREAIKVEKAGLEIEYKKTDEFDMPDELHDKFKEIPELKKAFCALTPGRQRGYLLFFSGAKQSKTREARIEKSMDKIFDGKGLDD